ncbi:MAG: hypothetical protein AAGA06_02485 [Pseudomonadota bacterium]
MSGIGHNGGPTMDKGRGWRRYAWTRARAELLPKMPIEVVRRRVKRARELGLDYKAYAGIRAATGRDVIALLFSDNALRLMADARMPANRAAHLQALRDAECLALVHPPAAPALVLARNSELAKADLAPGITATWPDIRARVQALKGTLPADGVVVIGETWLERDWCEAARLAGYLSAERYFAAP